MRPSLNQVICGRGKLCIRGARTRAPSPCDTVWDRSASTKPPISGGERKQGGERVKTRGEDEILMQEGGRGVGAPDEGRQTMERREWRDWKGKADKNNGKWQEASDGKHRVTRKGRKWGEMGGERRESEITAILQSILSQSINSQATWTSVLHCMMAPTRFLTMQR